VGTNYWTSLYCNYKCMPITFNIQLWKIYLCMQSHQTNVGDCNHNKSYMLHIFECVHPITKTLISIMSLHSYSSEEFYMQYWSIVHGFNLFCVSSFMRGHEWSETYLKCFYMAGYWNLHIICEKLTLSHQLSASPGCDTWNFPQNQLLAIWFFCY